MARPKAECLVAACESPAFSWLFCQSHYSKARRWGKTCRREDERFYDRCHEDERGCWVWPTTDQNGYGTYFHSQGEHHLPHRWSYEFMRGTIPQGLVVDHLCRNRACVNPWHMETVTQGENVRRSFGDRCPNGHAYSPENTVTHARGHRECITCRQVRDRRRAGFAEIVVATTPGGTQ
jgi:hypothetical protein